MNSLPTSSSSPSSAAAALDSLTTSPDYPDFRNFFNFVASLRPFKFNETAQQDTGNQIPRSIPLALITKCIKSSTEHSPSFLPLLSHLSAEFDSSPPISSVSSIFPSTVVPIPTRPNADSSAADSAAVNGRAFSALNSDSFAFAELEELILDSPWNPAYQALNRAKFPKSRIITKPSTNQPNQAQPQNSNPLIGQSGTQLTNNHNQNQNQYPSQPQSQFNSTFNPPGSTTVSQPVHNQLQPPAPLNMTSNSIQKSFNLPQKRPFDSNSQFDPPISKASTPPNQFAQQNQNPSNSAQQPPTTFASYFRAASANQSVANPKFDSVQPSVPRSIPSADSFDHDESPEPPSASASVSAFMTASDRLRLDATKKLGGAGAAAAMNSMNSAKPSGLRRPLNSAASQAQQRKRFQPPGKISDNIDSSTDGGPIPSMVKKAITSMNNNNSADSNNPDIPEELKSCDPKLVELIMNDLMDSSRGVDWSEIAGLEFAKKSVREIVVWPFLNPGLFTGLRAPARGILLFGPPGTGKTMIGKAIAAEARAKFFSISASSLTSKWHGEGEKLVRTLFQVAAHYQPSIIFIDEIDSLLSQRGEGEFEASRRIKTEFFIQLDGANAIKDARILVVGATNRPQELDEAARRRLSKRLYIPLPDYISRLELLKLLLQGENHSMKENEFIDIANKTAGYSGSDIRQLATEAAYGPIRSIDSESLVELSSANVRSIDMNDFHHAMSQVRASVAPKELKQYIEWNKLYGATKVVEEEAIVKSIEMEL